MSADIYERHARAVEFWREACKAVERAERTRDETRAELDAIGQELLASCAAPKKSKPINKRGRKAKHLVEATTYTEENARNIAKIPLIKVNGAAVQG